MIQTAIIMRVLLHNNIYLINIIETQKMCIQKKKPKNTPKKTLKTKKITLLHIACDRSALSWDDYFMSVAFLSAQRSKDPNRQVKPLPISRGFSSEEG